MCRMAHRAEGFLCYQEKCQTEICCPAKSEIYKKKRQVPQKEENDDRFKIFKRESGSCKQNIKNKFQDHKLPLVDEVIELDAKARAVQQEADDLRASRNKLSKQIGQLMGQGKKMRQRQ